jgi:hypothetical protein
MLESNQFERMLRIFTVFYFYFLFKKHSFSSKYRLKVVIGFFIKKIILIIIKILKINT